MTVSLSYYFLVFVDGKKIGEQSMILSMVQGNHKATEFALEFRMLEAGGISQHITKT